MSAAHDDAAGVSTTDEVGAKSPHVRIAVDNDFPIVIAGVEALLSQFDDVVRVVALHDGPDAPDVILYDTFGADGSLEAYVAAKGSAKVAVFTSVAEPAAVLEAIHVGAAGYILKGSSAEELVGALVDIHHSTTPVLALGATAGTDEVSSTRRWPGDIVLLTEREAEVLALVCQGLSNKDIAAALFISVNSVKSYIRLTYRKIGVDTRSRAMLWGLAQGLGTIDAPGAKHLKPPVSHPS